jgi:hypothetical protein
MTTHPTSVKSHSGIRAPKPLATMNQLCVCGFIVEIDGDGSVFAFRFGGLGHVSSPSGSWSVWMRHGEVNMLKWQGDRERIEALPHNPGESEIRVASLWDNWFDMLLSTFRLIPLF